MGKAEITKAEMGSMEPTLNAELELGTLNFGKRGRSDGRYLFPLSAFAVSIFAGISPPSLAYNATSAMNTPL
jgi:hypothetical protein